MPRPLIFLLLASSALFAGGASAGEQKNSGDAGIFTAAYKHYARTDYSSAAELFRQLADKDTETGYEAAMYLASIYAYEGKAEAYRYFERALKTPNLNTRRAAISQYSKYCAANGEWNRLIKNALKYANSDSADSLSDWYLALALWNTGDKGGAKKLFNETIQLYFNDASASGIDEFIDARLNGDAFASFLDISQLGAGGDVSKARKLLLKGEVPTGIPQKNLPLYVQIKLAEAGQAVDLKILEDTIFKYKGAPFAYEGALALGKIEFSKKNYEKAIMYAEDALRLAPPHISSQWGAYMLMGDSLRMQKKYDAAREYYLKIAMNKASRGEPIAESLYKVGVCWYEQGQWGKAHAYFERVFVAFFRYEYWGSRAYYYDARALFTLGLRRDANATLIEYFRRAKDKNSKIYKMAREFYDKI